MSDVEKFKAHPFFKGCDWVKIFNREIDPPYVPHIDDSVKILQWRTYD